MSSKAGWGSIPWCLPFCCTPCKPDDDREMERAGDEDAFELITRAFECDGEGWGGRVGEAKGREVWNQFVGR